MDPLTLTAILVEVLALCEKAVEQMKRFWNAHQDLRKFMTKITLAQRTIQSILTVVTELKAAGLTSLEFSLDLFITPLRDVIQKILQRIHEILTIEPGKPRSKFIQKLLWTFSRDKIDALEKELRGLETAMAHQVNAMNLLVTTKYLGIVQTSRVTTLSSDSELNNDPFSSTATLVNDESETDDEVATRTWLGNLNSDKHDKEYVQQRANLANAAKYADWDEVFDLLASAHKIYGESWINAPRIKRGEELQLISLWTPLHQAVYMCAPVEVVSRLLSLGASKTLRTRWTEFPWSDMTPLELTQHLGAKHLIDLLRPIIHVPIPMETLNVLQNQFHELIKHDMGEEFKGEEWCLPQLEMLLEFEPREWTWFPVDFSDTSRIAGYWYRIDGRDLLVWSGDTSHVGTKTGYRITVAGIFEVQQA